MGNTRPEQPLQNISDYLRRNFPDFFAEARFHAGDDDYFLYARFGAYLARAIEHNRAPRGKINRGFTVLNKLARASSKHPCIQGARPGEKAPVAAGTGISRGTLRITVRS